MNKVMLKNINSIRAFGFFVLIAPLSICASEFSVTCSYSSESLSKCAAVISDIVTEKFIAKFSADDYQIFVHSNIHSYSDGGYVAYAVSGVVPKSSGEFPLRRFSTTRMNREKRASLLELAEVEKYNYRDAVKQLMDYCEISPACDVYISR